MERLSKEVYFLQIAELAAERSTCPRRSVGSIVVDKHYHILATGYNGVPSGFPHCTDYPCGGQCDEPGQTSRCLAVHSEQNALLQCHDTSKIVTLYTTTSPCFVCTKMLLNLPNLRRVVYFEDYPDERAAELWKQWQSMHPGNLYWKFQP